MTYRTRNILIAIIVILSCALIATPITLLILKDKKESEAIQEKYDSIESELRPLKEERNALSNELFSIENKLNGIGYNLGSSMIMLTDAKTYFLDNMYPYLSDENYSIIISLDTNYFINTQGMMDSTTINQLVEQEGYELSMTLSKQTNIEALYQNFSKKGLLNPTIAYYLNNEIDDDSVNRIKSLGIKNIILYNGRPKIEDDMFYLRAYPSNTDTTKKAFSDAIDNSYPFVITIGYTNSDERYNATNFSNMLSSLKTYKEEFPVESTSNAKIRYMEYQEKLVTEKDSLLERKMVVQNRLEELKEEIARRSKTND